MLGVFAAVTAIFLKNDFILVFELIFCGHVVSAPANGADKTEFDNSAWFSHTLVARF